eukprot:TRINITY_DN64008_c0_g2_i1.p1 TRINITY_DN64008_c0_g2~~TRINITY_DN64008_c0_g2_i1.p1  ORF type:complete len:509 (-),score=74.49 TRINITY_DN64008_c0_g2_i1:94-1620(-)
MARLSVLALLSSLDGIRGACPAGFNGIVSRHDGEERCFFVSQTRATYADCQGKICAEKNSSLASISDGHVNEFLYRMLEGDVGFIGLYEYGPQESGDWRWVNGRKSSYRNWYPNEPNNWCLDEDCAIFFPPRGVAQWFDASCGIQVRCLCELNTSPSDDYLKMEATIAATEDSDYGKCEEGKCFWQNSQLFGGIYVLVGVVCSLLVALMALRMCGVVNLQTDFDVSDAYQSSVPSSNYGFLLDGSDVSVDVDDVVSKWIVRGAASTIIYAVGLLALAVSMAMHSKGFELSFGVDMLVCLLMVVANAVVAASSLLVHKHLSPVARTIAGPWVLVLGATKAAVAICALAWAFVFAFIEWVGTEGPSFCYVGALFCWMLLCTLVFQTVAGLALFRVQTRAIEAVGDDKVFSRVVYCWWNLLILGTVGVGVFLYMCGAAFVLQPLLRVMSAALDPRALMPPFYCFAAISQLLAGLAMLFVNCMARKYFAETAGGRSPHRKAIELKAASGGVF